ncbi:MAG: nitrilase family protein [Bacteroidia bacterium]|nr:nitrilase family protein [Bacteroidia bacterium]
MQHLNILAVQANLIWENPGANLRHLEHFIHSKPEADLVVLPEMFATGFTMKPELCAENMDGESVQWLKKMSVGKAICGSLAIRENDQYFNRFLWAEDGAVKWQYDKRHLFSYGNEPRHYQPGTQKIIVEYKGWKIQPLVCYDLRFPVWCRNTEQAELCIFVANWPQVRIGAWQKLLQARAIENQCFVLGVNRVGEDGNNVYHNGSSMLCDFRGDVVWKNEDDEVAYLFQLAPSALMEFRRQFPVLEDMDGFEIKGV